MSRRSCVRALTSAHCRHSQSVARLTAELEQVRSRLSSRDRDLEAIQEGSRQLGETHTNDRFALELEVERVRRDLERAEEDLERAKRDLEKKEGVLGQREDALADMVSPVRIHRGGGRRRN